MNEVQLGSLGLYKNPYEWVYKCENEHISIQHFVNVNKKKMYCALQLCICMYINLLIYYDHDKSRGRNHHFDPYAVCWRAEILVQLWNNSVNTLVQACYGKPA